MYLKPRLVPRSKHSMSVIQTSQLMLYREIIAVCSQIHTKHINTLCGQKVEYVKVRTQATVAAGTLRQQIETLRAGQSRDRMPECEILRTRPDGPRGSRSHPYNGCRLFTGYSGRGLVLTNHFVLFLGCECVGTKGCACKGMSLGDLYL